MTDDKAALAAAAMRQEIEDMHERAWAREADRGNLDRAAWHQECAEHIRRIPLPGDPLPAMWRLPEVRALIEAANMVQGFWDAGCITHGSMADLRAALAAIRARSEGGA